jgi:hypothetical protein
MVEVTVCCINCKNDFAFDTDDPTVVVESYRSKNMPRIFIKFCPRCGKENKVKLLK